MYHIDSNTENRFYAKISYWEKYRSLMQTVYFRNDMTSEFFHRWRWYFKYRAALIQVQNPKAGVELNMGAYKYTLPDDEYEAKLKNLILAAKRKITEFQRKIDHARRNWNEIFPIEENPLWLKVQEKLNDYQSRLELLNDEYDRFIHKRNGSLLT